MVQLVTVRHDELASSALAHRKAAHARYRAQSSPKSEKPAANTLFCLSSQPNQILDRRGALRVISMRWLSCPAFINRPSAIVAGIRRGREHALGLTPGSTGLAALAG